MKDADRGRITMTTEDKKAAEGTVTFLNRGKRHFNLAKGADGSPRRHSPGTTMVYSAAEAEKSRGYSDLVDISKLPGQVDAVKIKADNERLAADNAALKAQLEALAPKDGSAVHVDVEVEAATKRGRK